MIPTSNWASSWKTTSVCRRTPTDGCSPFTVSTAPVPTLSVLCWPAMRCLYCQLHPKKVRWRLQGVTRCSCTRLRDHGESHPDRSTGDDFRSVKIYSNPQISVCTYPQSTVGIHFCDQGRYLDYCLHFFLSYITESNFHPSLFSHVLFTGSAKNNPLFELKCAFLKVNRYLS